MRCRLCFRVHRDHGVIGSRAVVVPAVDGNRERLRHVDALQLQIVHDEAGRQSRQRMDPRLDDDGCWAWLWMWLWLWLLHHILRDTLTNAHHFKFILVNDFKQNISLSSFLHIPFFAAFWFNYSVVIIH